MTDWKWRACAIFCSIRVFAVGVLGGAIMAAIILLVKHFVC